MRKSQMVETLIAQADFGAGYATVPQHVWDSIVLFLRAGNNARRMRTRIAGDLAPECPDYTPREAQIAQLVCNGLTDKQIGERLGIAGGTVKVMVKKARLRFMQYRFQKQEVA